MHPLPRRAATLAFSAPREGGLHAGTALFCLACARMAHGATHAATAPVPRGAAGPRAQGHWLPRSGWVTEGESAFGEMSGSAPKSVHQQALRGIAKVLLEVRIA